MCHPGAMPLIGDEYGHLATFPVSPDYKSSRGNLNFDAILLGHGDEAAASRRVRIARPDQIITGELRIPTSETEIPCARRKPFEIRGHAIYIVLGDRSDMNQVTRLCGPAIVCRGQDRRRHCGIKYVSGRLMDLSAGFYRVPRASERTCHHQVVVSGK